MIQRIQTIYLLLVIICLGLAFAFPFAEYQIQGTIYVFNIFGLAIEGENVIKFPYYVSIALSIGLSIVTISRFKNRALQMKLGRFNYLVVLLTIVMSFVNIRTVEESLVSIAQDLTPIVTYGIGLFLPVAALVFLFLANRAIKNDEKLIKSIDRIR